MYIASSRQPEVLFEKEFWLLMTAPTVVVGVWTLVCFILAIPNDIVRAIAMWSLIFALTLGAATVDVVRKQQSKR